MIVQIEAQFEPVERDGWQCANLTGVYTVTRIDQSKKDVTRAELIELLKTEPVGLRDACPKCGEAGNQFQQTEPDGDNHLCPTCGTYRVEESEDEG